MASVIVTGPKYLERDNAWVVSASIKIGEENKEVWYRLPAGAVASANETFLASALLPAMRKARPLQIEGPVSPRLLGNVPIIQEIFRTWDFRFQRIAIEATPQEIASFNPSQDVGCFFTGGLDSFYTVLKHKNEITHLVFVHGFDVPLDDFPLRARVSRSLREAAAKLQKPLIEVETNLRELSDSYVTWDFYHGAALASVGLLLSPRFRRMYIAASRSYADLIPLGSHPLLDPLWSTERTEIVHDGSEATRVEKAAAIASDDTAVRYLRVCWENRGGAYNCGQCEKCLRTMACLRTVGVLQRCPAFERPLDLEALAAVEVKEIYRAHLERNLEVLERSGADPELARALRDCLSRRQHRGARGFARRALYKLGLTFR